MPSAVIRSFAYYPESGELAVAFTTGRRYVYADVPRDAVEALRASFSKGRHFNRHIRGRFPHREIGADETLSGCADPALSWGEAKPWMNGA